LSAHRIPPTHSNADAEKFIIGALLQEVDPTYALASLQANDFFHPLHQRVFACLASFFLVRRVPTILATCDELNLNAIESAELAATVDGVPRSESMLAEHVRLVKKCSDRRTVQHACDQVVSSNDPDYAVAVTNLERELARLRASAAAPSEFFDSRQSLLQVGETEFAIAGFLQANAVNAIAGLAGNAKTWLALAVARSLLFGPGKLWGLFEVPERAEKVIYLVPECSRSTFAYRLRRMNLMEEVGNRLFVRTMNMGPAPGLNDPQLLREIKGAHLICDTAVRFMQQVRDEADAIGARVLSDEFFNVLRGEARSVLALFHSPKAFQNGQTMTLASMIRGSSEFGAVLAAAWGVRQIDASTNMVHIENLKARDFEPCAPFELQGRPYIDTTGDFQLLHHPGDCARLEKLQRLNEPKREEKGDRVNIVRTWLREDPAPTGPEMAERFRKMGVEVELNTVNKYRGLARKGFR
jgi:AAA domain/DnaB-like helicase N terminal domain